MRFPKLALRWQASLHYVLVLCLSLSCLSTKAQQPPFDRKAWIQDYAVLKLALENSYSNLAWFASPQGGVDLPRLDRNTQQALQRAKTDEEAKSAILAFVTAFHDGHFSRISDLQTKDATKPSPLPAYPYQRDQPEAGCAALGFAPQGVMAFSLPFESLPGFRLLPGNTEEPFRAGIATISGSFRIGLVRLAEFDTSRYPALCEAAWKGDVWDDHNKLNTNALQSNVEKLWYADLSALLKQFEKDNVSAVLVDVGSNPGGDDSGDISTRLFTAQPMHSSALFMSQNKNASGDYFEEALAYLKHAAARHPNAAAQKLIDERTAYFLHGQSTLASPCSMSWVWQEGKDWNTMPCKRLVSAGSAGGALDYLAPATVPDMSIARRLHWPARYRDLWGSWTRPVYILTNNRTYSSAEMFAAEFQNNRTGKIIGMKTGGDGCGFMNDPEPTTLPHSGLRFRIPNCVRMRVDGTDEVAGVTPDFPVLPKEGESARERANHILNIIQTDTAK